MKYAKNCSPMHSHERKEKAPSVAAWFVIWFPTLLGVLDCLSVDFISLCFTVHTGLLLVPNLIIAQHHGCRLGEFRELNSTASALVPVIKRLVSLYSPVVNTPGHSFLNVSKLAGRQLNIRGYDARPPTYRSRRRSSSVLSSTHAAQSRARRYLIRFAGVVRPLQTYLDLVGNVAGSLPGMQLGGVVWGALLFVIKVPYYSSNSSRPLAGSLALCALIF